MSNTPPAPGSLRRAHELQTAASATLWRVLRNTYLRRIVAVPPASLDEPEQNTALDPYMRELEADHDQIMAIVAQAFHEGVSHVHQLLHGREGVDHEMLDQTVEYAALSAAEEDAET